MQVQQLVTEVAGLPGEDHEEGSEDLDPEDSEDLEVGVEIEELQTQS